MSQRLYTLLRPISHVTSSPRHLSHSPNLRFHIYHHSLVRFACLSAKDCGTPWTVTLQSLQSCRSHTRCTAFGFWVLLLCTALIRRLSAYQRQQQQQMLGHGRVSTLHSPTCSAGIRRTHWIPADLTGFQKCHISSHGGSAGVHWSPLE